MSKIGVFVCHCGENIGRTVDCERVAKVAGRVRGVAYATDYKYMCSDPGQAMIKNAIKEYGLTGIVVAACSPHMHEKTFRKAVQEGGINPFLCECSNIREHCSWVHEKDELTTRKAIELVRFMVEKALLRIPGLHMPGLAFAHCALQMGRTKFIWKPLPDWS